VEPVHGRPRTGLPPALRLPREDPSGPPAERSELAQDISFADFIEVVSGQDSREQDPHWRRQVDQIGHGIIDYDAVIHLEELDASWDRVASLTGVAGLQEQFFCRNSTQAGSRINDYFTPAILANVTRAYAGDYSTFGYQPPVL
jgi:hypothetical protein